MAFSRLSSLFSSLNPASPAAPDHQQASPLTSHVTTVTAYPCATNTGYSLTLLSDPPFHPKIMVAALAVAFIFILLLRQNPQDAKKIDDGAEKPPVVADEGEKPITSTDEVEVPTIEVHPPPVVSVEEKEVEQAPTEVEPQPPVEEVKPSQDIPPVPSTIIVQHPGLDDLIEDFKSFSRTLLDAEPTFQAQLKGLEDRLQGLHEQISVSSHENQQDTQLIVSQLRLVEDRLAEFESRFESKLQGQANQIDSTILELRANTNALNEHQVQLQRCVFIARSPPMSAVPTSISVSSLHVPPVSHARDRRYPASDIASELSPGYQTDENHPQLDSSDVDVIPIHAPTSLEKPPVKRKNPKRERNLSIVSPKTVTFAASAGDSDDTAVDNVHSTDVQTPVEAVVPEVSIPEPLYSSRTDDSEVFIYKPMSELEPSPAQVEFDDYSLNAGFNDHHDHEEHSPFDDPIPQVPEEHRATPVPSLPPMKFSKVEEIASTPEPVALHSPVEPAFQPWMNKDAESDYYAPPDYSAEPNRPRVAEIPLSMPTAGPDSMTQNNLLAHDKSYAPARPEIVDLMDGSDSGVESSEASPNAAGEPRFPPGLTKNQKKAIKRKRREKAKKLNAHLEAAQSAGEYSSSQE